MWERERRTLGQTKFAVAFYTTIILIEAAIGLFGLFWALWTPDLEGWYRAACLSGSGIAVWIIPVVWRWLGESIEQYLIDNADRVAMEMDVGVK